MNKISLLLLSLTCVSFENDTGTALSYSSSKPCGPEIWQIECWGCVGSDRDGKLRVEAYEPVVVLCEISSDPQLDALELTFGDYALWREEFPQHDLVIRQNDKLEVDWKKWVETGPTY